MRNFRKNRDQFSILRPGKYQNEVSNYDAHAPRSSPRIPPGAILLPQFQRDYVWKPAKIRNLLDSLLRGFPIGGFYLWRPISGVIDPKQKALGKHLIESEFVGYLIDGQQRLTSLEAAFGLYTGEDRGAELRCYLDLKAPEAERARDTRLFVSYAGNKSVARRVEAGDSTLIPVSQIFQGPNHELRKETEETLKLVPGWDAKRVSASLDRFDHACDMLGQQVPCTTISHVTDKEAVEVFSRLNKGGTALSQGDVRAAELARGHAVVVLKNMREFVTGERMQRLGFGFSFAFRALVLFRESAQFSTLKSDWMDTPGPHGRSLSNSWRLTERAITEALAFDEVLGTLTSDQRKISSVQFFGEAAGDRLKAGRYEEFCEWRAARLAEAINDWLGID